MVHTSLFGAAVFALLSSVSACSCIVPAPLSECAVRDNEAALLIQVKSRTTFQCSQFDGTAIADALVLKVFKDNTDLELKAGKTVSIESSIFGNLCGFDLLPNTQYIVFANTPFVSEDIDDPVEVEDDDNEAEERDEEVVRVTGIPQRGLSQTKTASVKVSAQATKGASVSARGFSDGDKCEVPNGDLQTSLCSGNIFDPKRKQIIELMEACAAIK